MRFEYLGFKVRRLGSGTRDQDLVFRVWIASLQNKKRDCSDEITFIDGPQQACVTESLGFRVSSLHLLRQRGVRLG